MVAVINNDKIKLQIKRLRIQETCDFHRIFASVSVFIEFYVTVRVLVQLALGRFSAFAFKVSAHQKEKCFVDKDMRSLKSLEEY